MISDEYLLSLHLGSSEYEALSRDDQHRRYLLIMAKLDQERAENREFTATVIKACMIGAAFIILMVILAIPLSFYLGSR